MHLYSRRDLLKLGLLPLIPQNRRTRHIVVRPNPLHLPPAPSGGNRVFAHATVTYAFTALERLLRPVPASITVACVESWLTVSAPGGTPSNMITVNAGTQVVVYGNPSTLTVGTTYVGHIVVSGAGMQTVTEVVNFPVISAPATRLVFTTQPGGTSAGNVFTTQPVLQAQDAGGHLDVSYTGTVTIAIKAGTGTGGAVLSGTLSITCVAGIATFTNLSINLAGAGYTLTATSGSLTSADSASFTNATYTTYFSEPFSFATALNTHQSAPSFVWTDSAGVFTADGSKLTSSGWASGTQFGTIPQGSADGSLTYNPLTDYADLMFRQSDASNYWYVRYISGNGVYIGKVVAGVDTPLYRLFSPLTGSSNTYGAMYGSSSIMLLENNVVVWQTTDTFNQTATTCGVRAVAAGLSWDNIVCTNNAPYRVNASAAIADSDTFARANGQLGSTANGRVWSSRNIAIASNAATAPGFAQAAVVASQADGEIHATNGMGVFLRGSDDDQTRTAELAFNGAYTFRIAGAGFAGQYEYVTPTNKLTLKANTDRIIALRDNVLVGRITLPAATHSATSANKRRGLYNPGSAESTQSWGMSSDVSGVTPVTGGRTATSVVALVGNSLFGGAGIYFDPNRATQDGDDSHRLNGDLLAQLPNAVDLVHLGYSGQTVANLDGLSVTDVDQYMASATGYLQRIVVLYEGTNSSMVRTAAQTWGDMVTFATNRKNAGATKVLVCTWYSRGDGITGAEAVRVQVNRWLQGLDSGTRPSSPTWDGIIDGVTAQTGTAFYPTDNLSGTINTTYWQNGSLHPTYAGHKYVDGGSVVQGFNKPIIAALLTIFNPGPATQLQFRVQPATLNQGANFVPDVVVQALDTNGNLATGYSGSATLAISAGGTLTGTITGVAFVNGLADFTGVGVSVGTGAGSYTLSTTSGSLSAATSTAFTVVVPPTTYSSDNFTRANSSTTAGSDAQSHAWTASESPTLGGISSNQAYMPNIGTSALSYIYENDSQADGTISLTVANYGTSNEARLIFRATDFHNRWEIAVAGGNFYLKKVVTGTETQFGSQPPVSVAPGDVISVVLSGSSITAKFNGVTKATATDSFSSTVTNHGWGANDTNARYSAWSHTS